MKYRLIAVVSNDGYIARCSGDTPNLWTSKEEQIKFKKDIKDCMWSVMGRKTHELSYDIKKKRIIFSTSVKKYKLINKNHIFINPSEVPFQTIIDLIKPIPILCILGGTSVHDYFLDKNLINELVITVEPINFYKGLKLFSKLKWEEFPMNFIRKGFKIVTKNKINKKGTKYYYLLRN